MKRLIAFAALLTISVLGCNKSTPTSPSPPTGGNPPPATTTTVPATTTVPPAPTTFTVAGVLRDANSQAPIGGGNVRVQAGTGLNNSSGTDGNGYYSIPGVSGAIVLAFSAPNYDPRSQTVQINGNTNFDFTLTRTAPPWTMSGQGNAVFTMPSNFTRVRIQGEWNRTQTSNFIVRIGGRLVVNEILRDSITYDGTHLTNGGGTTEITNSNAIRWTFTEVR